MLCEPKSQATRRKHTGGEQWQDGQAWHAPRRTCVAVIHQRQTSQFTPHTVRAGPHTVQQALPISPSPQSKSHTEPDGHRNASDDTLRVNDGPWLAVPRNTTCTGPLVSAVKQGAALPLAPFTDFCFFGMAAGRSQQYVAARRHRSTGWVGE